MDETLISAVGTSGHFRPLGEVEGEVIKSAFKFYRGHMTEIARRLGIGRSTLYRKLQDLGLQNDISSDN
jgi:DNA-binding NtrC family response regulator